MESFFIQINGLTKSYQGHTILSSVSLSLPSHGLFLLKGENGSGKSTLLSILAGKDRDYQGTLFVNGKKIEKKDADKYSDSYVSYVPQDSLVFEDEKAIDDFLLPFGKKDRAKAEEILSSLGLASVRDEKCSELSEGEKERLCFGQALFRNRPILLLDEITANLDSQSQDILLRKILEVSKDRLVVFATHEGLPSYFEEEANVLLLEKGTLSFSKPGKEADALSTPAKPVKGVFTLSKKDRGLSFLVGCICLIRTVLSSVFFSYYFSLRTIVTQNGIGAPLVVVSKPVEEIQYKTFAQTSPYLPLASVDERKPGFYPAYNRSCSFLYVHNDSYGKAGTCISGVFGYQANDSNKPEILEGRAPENCQEALISDVCAKWAEYTIGSQILSTDRTVVGIYKAKNPDQVTSRYSNLDLDDDTRRINNAIRCCYAFQTESIFIGEKDNLQHRLCYLVPSSKESQEAFLKAEDKFVNRGPYYNDICVTRNGTSLIEQGFDGYEQYLKLGEVFSVLLIVFLFAFVCAYSIKNRRKYLLLRFRGVSRKSLIKNSFCRLSLSTGIGFALGVFLGGVSIDVLNIVYNSLMRTKGIAILGLSSVSIILSLGYLVFFRLYSAFCFFLLCPKDISKQIEETKKK